MKGNGPVGPLSHSEGSGDEGGKLWVSAGEEGREVERRGHGTMGLSTQSVAGQDQI